MSLIMTSGDYGAGCQRSKFSPYFPASSPYVTSVGATQIQRHAETAFYISGGEFSFCCSPRHAKSILSVLPILFLSIYFSSFPCIKG